MNFALAHVLGATIQTALFNSSLVVIVGWGLSKGMVGAPCFAEISCLLYQDLNFEVFNIVVLIMAIIVVGNFLRDLKSNYLEGALCILVYITIAVSIRLRAHSPLKPLLHLLLDCPGRLTPCKVAAYYYPNPEGEHTSEGAAGGEATGGEHAGAESSVSEGAAAATATAEAALRYMMR